MDGSCLAHILSALFLKEEMVSLEGSNGLESDQLIGFG
jgi:hypothetical protein